MGSPPSSISQSPNRVGACAVGLAYIAPSGNRPIAELIELSGGRIAVLAVARQRIRALDGVDAEVIDRAVGLLDAAIGCQDHRSGGEGVVSAER